MGLNSITDNFPAESHQSKLLLLGNQIQKNALSIEEIGDYIPGSVMVQDLNAMTNTYMNQTGCEILKLSSEELANLGPDYFERFFPKSETAILLPSIQKFITRGDTSSIYSFFQRVRGNSNEDYKWYQTTSRLYTNDEADSLKIMHISIPVDRMEYMGKKLNQLVEDDLLVQQNLQKYLLLSPREKQVIRLIAEGKSSCDIAELLYLSLHTINNHRKNILHKLEIGSLSQLIKFALAFSII